MTDKADCRKRKSVMTSSSHLKSSKYSSADSQLLKIISSGKHTEVANLLDSSFDQISTKTLETVVFQIAENGHKRLLQIFIKHGINVNCKNVKGQTVLMIVAQHGYLDLVKLLLRHGADVNSQTRDGKTALMFAAEKACCIPIMEFLISDSCRADVNIQDKVGRTALMVSTKLCDIAAMRVLMHHKGTDLTVQDHKGNTALDIAKQNGIHEEFCILQECIGLCYLNPLIISVLKGNLIFLKEFLDDDYYDINQTNADGETPLFLALKNMSHDCKDRNASRDIILTLIKGGADVNKVCLFSSKSSSFDICTPLLCAAETRNLEAIILLVEHGANVNSQSPICKISALMVAAQKGFYDILDFLLKKSADLHLKDLNNKVALTYALEKNEISCAELLVQHGAEFDNNNLVLAANMNVDLEKYLLFSTVTKNVASSQVCNILIQRCFKQKNYALIEFLLNHGVDVKLTMNSLLLSAIQEDANIGRLLLDRVTKINEVNEHGHTALLMAAYRDYGDAIQLLIEKGADMNFDCKGSTALTFAIKKHSINALKTLLHCGADVNYISQHPCSRIPLHVSITYGHNDIAELLIHYGADINSVDTYSNKTPLLLALKDCNNDIFDLLIAKGADLDKQTDGGSTALHFALMNQKNRMADMLIKAGANVNISDDQGKTPLMICSQTCTSDIMLLLLKKGANVNAADESGCSALHYAVKHSILLTEKAEMLLKYGADINKENNEGNTAFMIASRFCKENVLRCLLDHGADLNALDQFGSTALINAVSWQNYESAAFLINIGADVNIQNNIGQTALIAAADKCDTLTMKFLINAGADIHVVDKERSRNVLSVMLTGYNKCQLCSRGDFACKHYACLEILFDAGARPNRFSEGSIALYKAIICNKFKLVQLLVACGIPPLEMPINLDLLNYSVSNSFFWTINTNPWNTPINDLLISRKLSVHARSPLSTAMICKNSAICQFFISNWYFNKHDISRKSINMFHHLIVQTRETKFAAVCEEMLLKPWSLSVLSFVTVSTCVGSHSDREKRVRALPIPPILQEKLLYMDIKSNDPD